MELIGEAKLIRIFIGESDKLDSVPLFEKIVIEAKKQGLAGATVYRGIMGFGRNSRIHTAKILRLSEDLPVIIEIVDEHHKIESFLPALDNIFTQANNGGLVTIEKADIIKYTKTEK